MIDYYIYRGGPLPELTSAIRYILAGNGLFLHARRTKVEVLTPVCEHLVRGLPPLDGFIITEFPKVKQSLVTEMLRLCRLARDKEGHPLEIVFHFWLEGERGLESKLEETITGEASSEDIYIEEGKVVGEGNTRKKPEAMTWKMTVPEQIQYPTSCKPVNRGEDSYRKALLEIHSHHHYPAYFSATDDLDERGVFRFLGVVGNIYEKPEIELRLGIYGYFVPLPASFLLELPDDFEFNIADKRVREVTENAF